MNGEKLTPITNKPSLMGTQSITGISMPVSGDIYHRR